MPEPEWDIAFRSTVRAARLRFEEEPSTDVRFPGDGTRESTSRSERSGLPDRVTAGRDYRDVTVAYRLGTRLTDAAADAPGGGPGRRSGPGPGEDA